jgi:hypothetical protein
MPTTGICRLCDAEGELRDSHILPRWVFRRIIHLGPDPQPTVIENGTRRFSGDQDSEYLLCGSCEQRLGKWENHVAKLAFQPDGTFPAFRAVKIRTHGDRRPEVEAGGSALGTETAYFAASVVWRASVSSLSGVSLGPYEDEFKAFLQGRETRLEHARLIVHVIDPDVGRQAIGIASHPAVVSGDGCREHQFSVPGMTFTFRVGGTVPPRNDNFCFLRTNRVWLIDGSKLVQYVGKKARAATPLGKQRRARGGRK